MNKFVYHSISLTGLRTRNEDEIEIIDLTNNNVDKPLFFSIMDGHGGSYISQYMKKNKILSDYFLNNQFQNERSICSFYKEIQNKLLKNEKKAINMGSTCLVVFFYKKKNKYYIKVVNLGDSRCIICNEYNIGVPLTIDHKPDQIYERKRILKEGGKITKEKNDDFRISGMSVSRSFGDIDCDYISQVPDIFDYKLNKTKFIILACDGVWDVLSNQEAVDFVNMQLEYNKIKKNYSSKSEENIAYLLGKYAINQGSQDNISIIIIFNIL